MLHRIILSKYKLIKSRTKSIKYEMSYKIEFQTAIHLHHIYKDNWVLFLGQNLVCHTDTCEDAMECDKNVIGIYKSYDIKTLVGHLPMEVSCLLTNLNATSDNRLKAYITGKRQRERDGAYCSSEVCRRYKRQEIC